MERIEMSIRERRRMGVMERVKERRLKVREAAEMMRVSYRQAKRIWQRYRQAGDAGLVHRGRGRGSNRARPTRERNRAVALYLKRYAGFGPLLASEHLADEHGIVVDHETLRRWLWGAGHWTARQRREAHRAARERRPRCGDLVQIDGSEHDWFEGRGPRAVLMVMVDDATNQTLARFYPAEDTASAYDVFERYVCRYGLPAALYPDRDSIYVCTREACLEEELADTGPETQFARAMRELDVDLIPAHSPQAKGRVERRHGLFQDRLVKEMRLLGICSIAEANTYLDESFLDLVNERYTVAPRDSANGHRPRPAAATLALTLSWQEPRTVAKDWTVRWRNRRFQIDARHAALGLPGRRILFVERRDGTLAMLYGQRLLTFREAPTALPPRVVTRRPVHPPTPRHPPAPDHPWRKRLLKPRRFVRPPSMGLGGPFQGSGKPGGHKVARHKTTT